MRKVSYIRTEFHQEDINIDNTLLAFVYDVPYFGACGIFPPFHILNEIFLSGGGNGGMSPGAIWQPFGITEEEYLELKNAVLSIEPMDLRDLARYCDIQFEFDPEFDNIQDRRKWTVATCEKHRESYHKKIKNRG
jgi:hypothetical protein